MSIDLTPEQQAAANVHVAFWNNDPTPTTDDEPPLDHDEDHGPTPEDLAWLDQQTAPPPIAPSRDTVPLRWVTDALDNPPPEPPVLIDGFMRAGEILALAAPRAIGKSFLTYNLAALLDQGDGKFLGQLQVRQKTRTLIAQGEIDEWNAYDRWKFVVGTGGRPEGVAETFERWRIRMMQRKNVTLDRETGTSFTDNWFDAILDPRIENTIREHGFGLFIVDPWAVYFGGAENSNDEAERALDKLRDLAVNTGCAVLVIHHIRGKGGNMRNGDEPEDMWRGASRLADWASTRVTLLPHYKDEKEWKKAGLTRQQARRICDVHFLRRGAATDDFSIAYDPRTGWWDKWVDPREFSTTDPEETRQQWNPIDVAALLAEQGGSWPSIGMATTAMGVKSHHTAAKYLNGAVSAGLLEEQRKGSARGFRLRPDALFDEVVPVEAYEADAPDPDEMERF